MRNPDTVELFTADGEPITASRPVVDAIIESAESDHLSETEISSLLSQKTREAIKLAQERVMERIAAEKALKAAALTFTTAEDWVFHRAEGGDVMIPYLENSGAEKLMHAFAVEIQRTSEDRVVHSEDETYEIVINGYVRARIFSDIWYPETGSRWSGDGFFSRGGKARIDPGDVRKSAITNFYNRCIKKVLGLRGLTKEDLEKVPTINADKIRTVTYSETGGGGGGGRTAISDILGEKHIAVFIPYEDMTNRDRVKKTAGVRFHREEHPVVGAKNLWIMPYSDANHKMVADLVADNGKIRFKVVEADETGGEEDSDE